MSEDENEFAFLRAGQPSELGRHAARSATSTVLRGRPGLRPFARRLHERHPRTEHPAKPD
jgi:hypothetical protein